MENNVAEVLTNDWGFWKDATENYNKIKKFSEKYWKEEQSTRMI